MNELRGHYKNLLIIAGTGRNSGKTTLASLLIDRFRQLSPVAVKISPHFHEPTAGLLEWYTEEGLGIYTENHKKGNKDSSRMLASGAGKVYYIQCREENIKKAFSMVYRSLPAGIPVICESPSLAKFIDPGVLFIVDNSESGQKKELPFDTARADGVFYPLEQRADLSGLRFTGGRWLFG